MTGKKSLAACGENIDACQEKVSSLTVVVHKLNEMVDYLDVSERLQKGCSRHIFGEVGVSAKSAVRIHGLRRRTVGKRRPVIAKFCDYNEKMSVLHAAYKLKETAFSDGEDFSLRVRQARKHLCSSCTSERVQDITVKLYSITDWP